MRTPRLRPLLALAALAVLAACTTRPAPPAPTPVPQARPEIVPLTLEQEWEIAR